MYIRSIVNYKFKGDLKFNQYKLLEITCKPDLVHANECAKLRRAR